MIVVLSLCLSLRFHGHLTSQIRTSQQFAEDVQREKERLEAASESFNSF